MAAARRFRHLLGVLETELADLRVYRVGEISIPVYILGRSPSGSWLGLSTRVVETGRPRPRFSARKREVFAPVGLRRGGYFSSCGVGENVVFNSQFTSP